MKYIAIIVAILTLLFCILPVQAIEQEDGPAKAKHALLLIDTDLDSAEDLILEVINENPNSAEYHFYCGRILGRQASEAFFSALSYAKKSLACLQKAVALAPNNVTYRKGLINFYLGAPVIAGGDEQAALEQVNIIKQLDSSQGLVAELHYYRKVRELATLENMLIKALAVDPKSAISHYQYGLLLQQKGEHRQAQSHFTSATKQVEDLKIAHEALYQLGRNAVFAEDFVPQGISALQHYLSIESGAGMPSKSWAHYRLSQLYALSSDTENAKAHLRLAADTDDIELLKVLKN